MAFYSYNKFRVIVVLLIFLIFWQIATLLKNRRALTNADLIEELENGDYNVHKKNKLGINVYYEALCPDSKHFVVHHLLPVERSLSEFLKVDLIPYGKATTTEKHGNYKFECQHGATECYANKIHSCAIDEIEDQTSRIAFVECMITDNSDPDAALDRCGESQGVETSSISDCANHEEGSRLLKENGDLTSKVALSFVPTITIDGSDKNLKLSLKDFKLAVCQQLGMPLPAPCL